MSDELDPIAAALRERVDRQLDASEVEPDFAALMRRTRDAHEELAARAGTDADADADADEDARVLAPFVEAYCARLDLALGEVGPGVVPRGRRRLALWVAGMAVAAAVILAVAVVPGVRALVGVAQREADPHAQSVDAARGRIDDGVAHDAVPAEPPQRPATRRPRTTAETGPAPIDVAPLEEVEGIAPEDGVPEDAVPERAAPPSKAERIAALDAEARRLWRAGKLGAAERKFRSLVKVGGRRRAVELAYVDLFALVKQRGGDLGTLYRDYLRRFPKGRYAEDAQAGLCRAASGAARSRCWATYRERFPDGKHRAPSDVPPSDAP